MSTLMPLGGSQCTPSCTIEGTVIGRCVALSFSWMMLKWVGLYEDGEVLFCGWNKCDKRLSDCRLYLNISTRTYANRMIIYRHDTALMYGSVLVGIPACPSTDPRAASQMDGLPKHPGRASPVPGQGIFREA